MSVLSGAGPAAGETGPEETLPPLDPHAPSIAVAAPPLLGAFNRAGVLVAADVHVAVTLGRLAGIAGGGATPAGSGVPAETPATPSDVPAETPRAAPGVPAETSPVGEWILLAVALAVRAPRLGHVFVDLAEVAETAAVESEEAIDLTALPWPEPAEWITSVAAAGSLVAVEDGPHDPTTAGELVRPLRLDGTRLYLDRYWREERTLADRLLRLAGRPMHPVPADHLRNTLERLLPTPQDPFQRAAAAVSALRSLAVIAGGPGTGKTTTVARVCALLFEEAERSGSPPPLIALCAPTGKAAARLGEAVREEAERMSIDPGVRAGLLDLRASTIHRLLGWRPGSHSRFRHDAVNPLPHDVVIVDETSMVSLTLMGRLVEAVRGDARLVLVGDPDQLTAIEAGAALRDIVGPAGRGVRWSEPMRALLELSVGLGPAMGLPPSYGGAHGFGDGVVVLTRGHRFGEGIGRLADAIRRGEAEAALDAARGSPGEIDWIELDVGDASLMTRAEGLEPLRELVVDVAGTVRRCALRDDAAAALQALAGFRLLCAHRAGPYGVLSWTRIAETWLAEADRSFVPDGERDYVGRPLLITRNDYELGLHNGDTGVIVRGGGAGDAGAGDGQSSDGSGGVGAPGGPGGGFPLAAFERDGELVRFAPSRLAAVETVHAMTVHKSQGSQFDVAAVLLPEPRSRILTRELLYTAVTRARRRLLVVGSEAAFRAAVERPVARSTGLRELLWTPPATST